MPDTRWLSKVALFALVSASVAPGVSAIICYTCTSTVRSEGDLEGQETFRTMLDSSYNLPPVHTDCALADNPNFASVFNSECRNPDDSCMKVSSVSGSISFVIRGCKSEIFKAQASTKIPCSMQTPSMCSCQTPLCNGVGPLTAPSSLVLGVVLLLLPRLLT